MFLVAFHVTSYIIFAGKAEAFYVMVLEREATMPDGTARWTTFSLGIYKKPTTLISKKGSRVGGVMVI